MVIIARQALGESNPASSPRSIADEIPEDVSMYVEPESGA